MPERVLVAWWAGSAAYACTPLAFSQSVQLNATVQAPNKPGTYIPTWDMVQEDRTQGTIWFSPTARFYAAFL